MGQCVARQLGFQGDEAAKNKILLDKMREVEFCSDQAILSILEHNS